MSETTTSGARPPRTVQHRIRIELPDDVLEQRRVFAEETLGVVDRTAARMGLPTTYVGGIAYIFRNRSLKIIAARGLKNTEPKPRTDASVRGPYRK
jgi:hypothetical protein